MRVDFYHCIFRVPVYGRDQGIFSKGRIMKKRVIVKRQAIDQNKMHGYKELAREAIELALNDIRASEPENKDERSRWLYNRDKALIWIRRGNIGDLSFYLCCGILNMSVVKLRRGILNE